jgi:orotidine-5'-phosphate decarboxylase
MSGKEFANPAERIMVALDVDELDQAREIATDIQGLGVTLKIGNQLGTYEGWQAAVNFAHEFDAQIFCDTKFKDIPETVKKSARAITRHQPEFFNIMADNNIAALQAAVEGMKAAQREYRLARVPILLGVTVLTSLSNEETMSIYGGDSGTKVQQFAETAARAGLDGVVCSAQEAAMLRANPITQDLLLVTPGIRPAWAASGDQSRITTPAQAIANGADYLVIGRPITQPPPEIGSSRDAVLKIIEEIS